MKCVPAAVLAEAALPWMSTWLYLLMHPVNQPFNPELLIHAKYEEQVRSLIDHQKTFQ